MRPVNKGDAPAVFTNYEDAKPYLTARLGIYCSYCERRIPTNLAIEHILPKDEGLGYAHLRNEWTNFLLACVNCNSTKGITIIDFANYVLPDRDNTFCCFSYNETGEVEVSGDDPVIRQMAQNTLDLVGLNTEDVIDEDEVVLFAALKRSAQRFETWRIAKRVRDAFEAGRIDVEMTSLLVAPYGFFSIWMKVFEGVPAVRRALIQIFANTAADCFDGDGVSISPRPQNATLANSGKV